MKALLILFLLFSAAHIKQANAGLFQRETLSKTCRQFSSHAGARDLCLLAKSQKYAKACKDFSPFTKGRLACLSSNRPLKMVEACQRFSKSLNTKIECLENGRNLKEVKICRNQFIQSPARAYCLKQK